MQPSASAEPAKDSEKPESEPKPRSRKSASPLFNFWVDLTLGLAMIWVLWVSVMMQVVFPVPSQAGGWELWGLSFDQWRNVQFFSLCGCALIALEHVVLHWAWICGVFSTKVMRFQKKPEEGSEAVAGVATLIGLMLLLKAGLIVAFLTVRSPSP